MAMDSIGNDDPSVKERFLIKGVLEGKPVAVAAKEAGYTKAISEARADRIINKPRVQKALAHAMELAGIDDASLALLIKRGLTARKVVYHNGIPVARDPDFYARHQYLRTALEVRGDIGSSSGFGAGDDDSWEAVILARRKRKEIDITPQSDPTEE